jgi:hypothetical protein
MLKIRMNPNPKRSSDFQQFAPFRVGVNKLMKIEFQGFLSDTIYLAASLRMSSSVLLCSSTSL